MPVGDRPSPHLARRTPPIVRRAGRLHRGVLAALAGVVVLPMFACLQQVSTGTGTTDPGATPTATATTTAPGPTPTGGGCSTDPATGVTLCLQISVCPGLSVDQGLLPGCGFRIHSGAVIDLECLCTDALCPIGVPDTCDQVQQLITSQTAASVCDEASQARCELLAAPDAGAAAPNTSTCTPDCRDECAGVDNCLSLCGC